MPSLKVSKKSHNDTFKHFYVRCVQRNNKFMIDKKRTDLKSICVGVCTPIVILVASLIVVCGWEHASKRFTSTYQSYHLYYVYIFIVCVIGPFATSTLLMHFFMNFDNQLRLKYILMIAGLICVIGNGTLLAWLTWEKHENEKLIGYWKWFCKTIQLDDTTYDYVCAMYGFYVWGFGRPVCLLLVIAFNYCVFSLNNKVCNEPKSHEQNGIKMNEMSLLSQWKDIDHDSIVNCDNTDHDTNYNGKQKSFVIFYWHFALGIGLLFVYCILYFAYWITFNNIASYQAYIYILILSTSSLKILLKYIGRKIDIYNVTVMISRCADIQTVCCNYDYKWYHFLSMEMFVEFGMSLTYFYYYYQLFALELWSLSNELQFFKIILIHIFSEICQSIIRFSKVYFDATKQWINWVENYNFQSNIVMKIVSFLLNIFEDESTLNEWRIRHSLDFLIRFISFVSIFIIVVIFYTAAEGYQSVGATNASEFQSKIEQYIYHMSIVFGCDMFYFSFVFFLILAADACREVT